MAFQATLRIHSVLEKSIEVFFMIVKNSCDLTQLVPISFRCPVVKLLFDASAVLMPKKRAA